MFNLGGIYDSGLYGIAQDQAVARVWFQRAAEKGEVRAAHNLACSYSDGEGGPVDSRLAAHYFKMAAEKNHIQAITNYGIALMRGEGVEKDIDEAKKWLTKSAKAGDELAVQQLGVIDMMDSVKGSANVAFSSSTFPGGHMFSFTGR